MARNNPTYPDTRRTRGDVHAGEVLRAARVAADLTQGELAERMTDHTGQRWTQFTITSFETARRLMSVGQLVALAVVLDLDVKDMVACYLQTDDDGRHAYLDHLPEAPEADYPAERVVR